MQNQILENQEKQEPAIIVVPPKQAIKELLTKLKELKNRQDELLIPIKDELEEIEIKDKQLRDEITSIMRGANKDNITIPHVTISDGAVIWKNPVTPHQFYKKEKLDAITDPEIKKILDECKEWSKQGEPKVNVEVY